MKVLLVGGSGMLGQYLSSFLRKKKYSVVVHGHYNSADVNFDITSPSCSLDLEKIEPNVIVNLVALTNVDKCESDPRLAYKINVCSAKNISNYVRSKNDQVKLIQISTDMVYSKTGFSTESETAPVNEYGKTKFEAEKLVLDVGGLVLRTNMFGKSIVKGRDSFTDWIYKSLSLRASIKFINNVYFNPLSFETISKFIEIFIKSNASGVYNLGAKTKMSKSEFAHYFAKQLNLDSSYVEDVELSVLGTNVPRPLDMTMNVEKIEWDFGIKLPKLEEEIDRVTKEYL